MGRPAASVAIDPASMVCDPSFNQLGDGLIEQPGCPPVGPGFYF